MKKQLILILCVIFLSCNQDRNKKATTAVVASNAPLPATNKPDSKREKLISELNEFNDAVAKKDKTKILRFFNFPLADSNVNFFEVDSVFDAKRKMNNGNIDKEMFYDSFDLIYQQNEWIEFNNLFKYINPSKLKTQDNLNYTNKIKDDGCLYFYSIQVKNDNVFLQYGTNSNDDYLEKHPDEEEICGEYAQMWTFKFDGAKLKFLKHRTAG